MNEWRSPSSFWSLNFSSNMTIFSLTSLSRCEGANRHKKRKGSTLHYSLPVESMLAWQHSQLIFHFEVLQTHGTRLLCEWQTRRSQRGTALGIKLAWVIWSHEHKSAQIFRSPREDSTSWDLLLKSPVEKTKCAFLRNFFFFLLKWVKWLPILIPVLPLCIQTAHSGLDVVVCCWWGEKHFN